jgi:hypothetical protein
MSRPTHMLRLMAIAAVPVISILLNGRDNALLTERTAQSRRSARRAPGVRTIEGASHPDGPRASVLPHAATGNVLNGPVNTDDFIGLGGRCDARNNSDSVVRYDQVGGRWLIVMPTYSSRIGAFQVPGCGETW